MATTLDTQMLPNLASAVIQICRLSTHIARTISERIQGVRARVKHEIMKSERLGPRAEVARQSTPFDCEARGDDIFGA